MVFVAMFALVPETVLAIDAFVVGSRVGGKWVPAPPSFAAKHRPMAFRPFGVGAVERTSRVRGFVAEESDGGTYLKSEAETTELGRGRPLVAGATPRVPRKVAPMNVRSAVYEATVSRFLKGKGLSAKPQIRRLYRTDLDGDGTAEVLIEAGNFQEAVPGSSKNAYSLVLLRAVRGGAVQETALEFDDAVRDGTVEIKRIRGVADLDGDGRMEVLTTGQGYEWNNATLWGYRAGAVRKLLTNAVGH